MNLFVVRGGSATGGHLVGDTAYLSSESTMSPITLLASQTADATNAGTAAVGVPIPPNAVAFVLDNTANTGGAIVTLDIFVQALLDGANWVDVWHCQQLIGTSAPNRYISKLSLPEPQTPFGANSALATNTVRHLAATQYRARWELANGPGTFTFSIVACRM